MILSDNAGEETKKIDQVGIALPELRERMDDRWSLFRLDSDKLKIPQSEGEWDTVISNRAKAEGNKIIEYLAYAQRKIWVPITDEKQKGRKDISDLEHLVNGGLYLADSMNEDDPLVPPIQNLLAFYRVIRGIAAIRFFMREEDGKLIPDLVIWDARNTYWIIGKKRFLWSCYVRYASKEQVLDEYPGWNGSVDATNGMVKIHDVWAVDEGKNAQEGVIIGSEYVKEPEDMGIDYIPVRIKAGRSVPLIHDDKYSDNIKFVGEDFMSSRADLYAAESRLLSYRLTMAGQQAKAPAMIEWNSLLSGNIPPTAKFEKDPFVKGRVLPLDSTKGQKYLGSMVPPGGPHIDETHAAIVGLISIDGLSPIAYGQINQALPAQGIDILTHSTMDVIKPFQQAMEQDFVWLAGEITRQFKNGDFEETEFEGYDASNNRFQTKIAPKDIVENWRFECKLLPDLLRDKSANMNLASQAVRDKLLSRQTARDDFSLVQDTDLEEEKIEREEADALFGIGVVERLFALIKDYQKDMKDPKTRFVLEFAHRKLREMGYQPEQEAAPTNGQTMPAKMNNNLTARRPMPAMPGAMPMQIPEEIKTAVAEGMVNG